MSVFSRFLDVAINQIGNRFTSLENIVEHFSVLFPKVLIQLKEEEIYTKAKNLQTKYEKDIGTYLPLELISLRNGLKNEIDTIFELAVLLYIKYDSISSSYPETLTVLVLFLTLPVTVVSAEKSFSVLKRIKNYLRNSMGLLAINYAEAAALDKSALIRQFANIKSRKKYFI